MFEIKLGQKVIIISTEEIATVISISDNDEISVELSDGSIKKFFPKDLMDGEK